MTEQIEGMASNKPRVDDPLKRCVKFPIAVSRLNFPRDYRPKHCWSIDEADALNIRSHRGVKHRFDRGEQAIPRIAMQRGSRVRLLHDLLLNFFDNGLKYLLFVAKVMISAPLVARAPFAMSAMDVAA